MASKVKAGGQKKRVSPSVASWVAVFVVFFAAVWSLQQYKLYDIEQTRVFVYYASSVREQLLAPAGVADVAALWLQQFFLFPAVGPLIMALIFLGVSALVYSVARSLGASGLVWQSLSCLPAALLFVFTEDKVFFVTGHIAVLMAIFWVWLYCRFSLRSRLLSRAAALLVVPLAWWTSWTCAWVVAVCLLAITIAAKKDYIAACLTVAGAALSFWAVTHFCWAFSDVELFSPNIFTYRTRTESVMWMVWVAVCLLVALPLLPPKRIAALARGGVWMSAAAAIAVTAIATVLYKGRTDQTSNQRYALQRAVATQDYRKVFDFAMKNRNNLYATNHLCMVLALSGNLSTVIGGDIVNAEQIIMGESNDMITRKLLMDIYYTAGYVAGAQHEAFEYNEPMDGMSRPDALKILAKTNLAQGNYKAAAKYLDRLEHTLFYRGWARHYKQFLHNDAAVEADPELGPRRLASKFESLPERWTSIPHVMRQIAHVSPTLPASQYYKAFKALGEYRQQN